MLIALAAARARLRRPWRRPRAETAARAAAPHPPPSRQAIPISPSAPIQRGYYLTAFNEATKRAQQNDPAAMTLLGELYAQGLGVGRDDDARPREWYKLAAAQRRPQRHVRARDVQFRRPRAARTTRTKPRSCSSEAAKLGHPAAAYDLGLLYLQGQQFPQDFKRAAELFRAAADAGNPEAQYALATMYKEGRGVPKDMQQGDAADGAGLARAAISTPWSNSPSPQFNGTGTPKNETARRAAVAEGRASRQRRSRRTGWRAS